MTPKLSIIIPIFNVEKYLDQCLDSIESQTLKDIEIICVIDKSPDACLEICKKHQKRDDRIVIIDKDINEGLGLTRNAGLRVAHGEYVAFCDSDDYLARDAYETVYNVAKQKDLDICYFNYKRFYNNGDEKDHSTNKEDMFFMSHKDVMNYLLELIGPMPFEHENEVYPVSSCMGIFRRELIQSNAIEFISERQVASEDIIFDLDLLPHAHRIGRLANAFYYYRVNLNSISTTYSLEQYERTIRLMEHVRDKLRSLYPVEVYSPHYASFIMTCYRGIIRKEALNPLRLFKLRKRLQLVLSSQYIKDLLEYPHLDEFSLKNKYLITCMKYKWTLPIIILYRIFYPTIIKIRKV